MLGRRRFLRCLLSAAALLSLPGFERKRVNAATVPSEAQVPLSQLSSPWSFAEVQFTKKIMTHRGLQPSTFPGYVIRLPDAIGQQLGLKQNLYAISRICPHEGCPINFYQQKSEAIPIEVDFLNPLLVCSCHKSVFDPAQGGKVLSGPAPRPPWTFDFIIEKGKIVIKDLERGGEKWG